MKNGAQYIIEFLMKKGVDVVFGYPGGQILNFYEYLGRYDLKHILVGHEQGAAHGACGYARATGKPGVCIATSGPGATNLVTGIADAHLDSIPLLAITGQVNLRDIGKDSFQEADITGIVTPITKHSYLLQDLEQLPAVLDEAWQVATTGRPGPVLIDVPKNLFLEEADMASIHNHLHTRKVLKADRTEELMPKILAELAGAKRPLILAGGGVITAGAWELLAKLVEKSGIPVVNTLMGKGAFPETHPLSFGMVGMHGVACANLAISSCDVLLCVGTRFSDRVTSNRRNFLEQAKIIHVDADGAEPYRLFLENDMGEADVDNYVAASVENPERAAYLAMLDGAPVGMFHINLGEHPGRAFLYGVGISPGRRGQGLGQELMLLALAEARAMRDGVVLDVDSGNAPAYHIYQKLGFCVTFQVDYFRAPVRAG